MAHVPDVLYLVLYCDQMPLPYLGYVCTVKCRRMHDTLGCLEFMGGSVSFSDRNTGVKCLCNVIHK